VGALVGGEWRQPIVRGQLSLVCARGCCDLDPGERLPGLRRKSVASIAKNEALDAYKELRDDVAARLSYVSPDPHAPSPELRALATRLLQVTDAQAGLSASAPALAHNSLDVVASLPFEAMVRRCAVLSGAEWSSVAIPSELWRLANAVAAA
jgi:hypothetical protein